ncbi:hypothetical protein [Nonomuraea sp. 10N515B]|uniref:hypothetical protein n=1 Tax=Nonomuraea sp. 10N515B TaxID=3457422 RepID=UPI003FCE3330
MRACTSKWTWSSSPGAEQLKPDLVELRGRGERLGVRPRSGDGWVLIRTPEGLRCERGPVPAEADVVVSGAAADLMLVCSRRLPSATPGWRSPGTAP